MENVRIAHRFDPGILHKKKDTICSCPFFVENKCLQSFLNQFLIGSSRSSSRSKIRNSSDSLPPSHA